MKTTIRLLAFCAALALLSTSANAQRTVGAKKLIIDNGFGQTITIQTPASGWSGNIQWVVPIPPPGNPSSGFSYPGSLANQILTWVMPNTTGPAPNSYPGGVQGSWQPTSLSSMSILTGTGTAGTIPLWSGATTQGNSLLTDNGSTLNYTGGTINTSTGYQIGAAATTGTYLRGNGTRFVMSGIQVNDVPTLNQSTTGTAANVTGTVVIGNGGTGQTSQQAAINALTGAQSAGKYLRSDGTNATLSSLSGADLTNATVGVAKINASGSPSATTYLRGDGTWSTPPAGGGGSAPTLVDNNSVTLGTVLGFNFNGSVNIITSSGYVMDVLMNPIGTDDFPISQIYWTAAGCSGTAYLNDGGTTGSQKYYKQACYSGSAGSLYALAGPYTNNTATSVSFTAATLENPTCGASAGARSGWLLTALTHATAGLPTTIAYPLTIQ
jgi:hypothetical protein